MKRNMQYVILIILIFSLQIIFYTNFIQYQSHVENESIHVVKLKQENQALKIQMAHLQNESLSRTPRSIASVDPGHNSILKQKKSKDFSELDLLKANQLLGQNKKEQALKLFIQVQDQAVDEKIVAEAVYKKIALTCATKLVDSCLKDTDFMVSQFPHSDWTGKALVVLSNLYSHNNKPKESKLLLEVAKREFNLDIKNVK